MLFWLKSVFRALFLFSCIFLAFDINAAERFQKETLSFTTSDGIVHSFDIEIADTEAKRELGLMFRNTLDENQGMLFVFEQKQRVRMWMKNTFLPLDMIFLDENLKIQRVAEDAAPQSEKIIDSVNDVDFVLEVAAGTVRRLGLKAGDQAKYSGPHPVKNK